MKKAFLLFILLMAQSIIFAGKSKTDSQKVVLAYKAKDISIKLDGKLTEPIWQSEPIKDFVQRDPVEGAASTEKTEVWIVYDDNNLYVAAHLYDTKPELIDASVAPHK